MVNPVNICSAYVHIVALCLACSLFYCMADSGCCHDDLMMIHRRCHDNYCYHRHLILTYSHCYHYYCCDICHLKSSKNLKLKNKKNEKLFQNYFHWNLTFFIVITVETTWSWRWWWRRCWIMIIEFVKLKIRNLGWKNLI